jgi:DNA polymerase sigma
MAKARRRVPYSLGPEKLGPDPSLTKKKLGPEEEAKLSKEMQELYQRLLPSSDSEARRIRLVEKLEKLLRDRWPGFSVKVNVFGSTGNNLGTSDSDVDICITTNCKELSRVCSIAELLANNGMERVVCVSSAKVPIVKIWDPELQVACDLNVNNPIALENTALIKKYVEMDRRVRPLAMIIKHWAKRRILNDAGKTAPKAMFILC